VPDKVSVELPLAPALIVAPPRQADIQAAVGHGELRGGQVAVDVVHRNAADRERRVLVQRSAAPGTVFTRAVVHRVDGDRTASESVAPFASVDSTG
jgi:hypothetical protein